MQHAQKDNYVPVIAQHSLLLKAALTAILSYFTIALFLGMLRYESAYYADVVERALRDVAFFFDGAVGGPYLGLCFTLLMDWLGKYIPAWRIDWTLIRWWSKLNPILKIPGGVILAVWWSVFTLIFCFVGVFALIFLFAAERAILVPLLRLVEAIINRIFVFVPYIPSKEDAEAVKKKIEEGADKLKSWWQGRQS